MSESRLFTPLKIGRMQSKHRMVMAPLTRFRADDKHVQLPFVKEYYGQRASEPGTLLITEATFISARAAGYKNVPGIWSKAQIAAWKDVTAAVHAKGSFIVLQLWALGRTADPNALKDEGGFDLVSASAIPMKDGAPTPRPLSVSEIQSFIADYAQAARNAIAAGFDGVEIHGANGYLVDQFTQDVSNHRSDEYGGSVEKRSRFGLEVAAAVAGAIGADRTGIRLSPYSTFQGMKMADPKPQFSHFVAGLKELDLAYIHLVESRIAGNADVDGQGETLDFAFDVWGPQRPILVAGGFKADSAKKTVDEDYKDQNLAVVFGRYFISNPDLPFRLRHGLAFQQYNRDTFYKSQSPEGYVDYPFSREFMAAA